MDNLKIEQLHSEILDKVTEYYNLVHRPSAENTFVPGQSRINN